MPVRPSSAAFLNVACGKWPVSSSSLASGRTSDSANSRTVFWRRDCSSVRSRFMGGSSLAQKVEKDLHRGRGGHGEEKSRFLASLGMTAFRMTLGGQGFAEALIGDAEVFGVDAGFSGDGHEIGIAEPAREGVEVEMADDACACGAAEVHAEIHAVRLVICLEGFFHALGQMHHFAEGIAIAQIQFGDVSVGNDHDVAGGVREAVEDDENLRAAIDDERVLIVLPGGGVAKNAVGLFPRHDLRHVRIAPGGPEIVHREASSKSKSCAHSIAQNGVRVARASTRAQEVSANSQIRFCEGKKSIYGCFASPEVAPADAAASELFTKSLSSLLGLKKGIFFGGTSTFSPVLGLRPTRPRRWRVRKLPKPRISILSPLWRDSMMLSKMVSTMVSDSLRGSSVMRRTSSMRSAFVSVSCLVISPMPRCRASVSAAAGSWCETV